jgi:hypothetical protein
MDEAGGEGSEVGEADIGGEVSDGGEEDYYCHRTWLRENSWYQEYVEGDHSC